MSAKTQVLGLIDHAHASAPKLAENAVVRNGLSDHPGHEVARRQMSGFGGMVSFELDGTFEEVVALVSSRRYFTLGESLGGVKALLCHPASMTHASIPAEARAELGLSDTLIRLSPGCENSEDLVHDLLEGLEQVEQARSAKSSLAASAAD